MSDISILNQSKTICSIEIVKIINELRESGKPELRHDNFIVKVQKVLGDSSPKFLGVYIDQNLIERKCYYLPKREASLMVMSESYKVQAAVYDRMTELETQVAQPLNPANLSRLQLIELAMQAEQERLMLEAKVQTIEPKAKALDRISESEGSQCITDSAKGLKIQPKRLFAFLQEHGWIYRRPGGKNWVGYQDKVQCGLVEHKFTTVEKSDGSEKTVEQVLLTPKGIAKLADMLNVEVAA